MNIKNLNPNNIKKIFKPTNSNTDKLLSVEEIAQYIQKNIRFYLGDSNKTKHILPAVKHDYINKMSLEILNEKNNEKLLLLGMKNDKHPEISCELAKGTTDQILSNIDKYDFTDRFSKLIDEMKSCFIYD